MLFLQKTQVMLREGHRPLFPGRAPFSSDYLLQLSVPIERSRFFLTHDAPSGELFL